MDAGTAQLKDVSGTLRALTPEDIGYVFPRRFCRIF